MKKWAGIKLQAIKVRKGLEMGATPKKWLSSARLGAIPENAGKKQIRQ